MEIKEYKVLEIYDSEMSVTDQKIIILELGEVEKMELSTGTVVNMFGEAKKFLIDFNSLMFPKILEKAQNEEYITLDTSEFRFREENRNEIMEEIAYHKDVFLIGLDN
ncbi:hypothetical protein [Xanthomarina gelatinilytica]|uniref:hypothetical protein n=1 Tax=Xanthomarina gelatinilytica TaxID=1137281 RepID=UPI003AA92588